MPLGSLQAKFNDRGFTFITPEAGSEVVGKVFLHISQLAKGEDAKYYVRGARVEFDVLSVVRNGENRLQARNTRLLPGGVSSIGSAAVVAHAHSGSLKFWSPTGYGFVNDQDSSEDVYVHTDSVPGGYLRPGDSIQFDLEKSGKTVRAINVNVVSWSATGEPFSDTLDMGNPAWAPQLASLAEDEEWNYTVKPSKDSHVVLRSYIKYTFLRLRELPDHVVTSADDSTLSFNTGLVTSFQEPIFALFRRRSSSEAGPPWQLQGFEKASNFSVLKHFGGRLPPLAWYYDQPGQLVYDTNVPLYMNVEHVPHDPERFPDSLKSLAPEDLAALVNSKAPESIERVRRNYKTAIPQFYRDGKTGQGKMQLLLPVALLRRDSVELALAVDRLEHNYLGRTVLPLDWAYNNARLLTRPDTDWLRP